MESHTELYRRRRPAALKHVYGQKAAVTMVTRWIAEGFPHSIGLLGPSGCGKTTLARIISKKLGCGEADFTEQNCANFNGVDDIRSLTRSLRMKPLSGPVKVYLLDEVHMLSTSAQNAILKELEDCPAHVYFLLATTDPVKLLPTLKSRLKTLEVKPIPLTEALTMMRELMTREGVQVQVSDAVLAQIHTAAEGGGRKMIQLLEEVMATEGEDAQHELIQRAETKAVIFDLFKGLVWGGVPWPKMAETLTALDQNEAEGVRRALLTMCSNQILKAKDTSDRTAQRCSFVIDGLRRNLFDTGKAGLVEAVYHIAGKK